MVFKLHLYDTDIMNYLIHVIITAFMDPNSKTTREKFSHPPGFEPQSPGTESQCATKKLRRLLGMTLPNCALFRVLEYKA